MYLLVCMFVLYHCVSAVITISTYDEQRAANKPQQAIISVCIIGGKKQKDDLIAEGVKI